MSTITITIQEDGLPVQGAAVTVGEIPMKKLVTDANGRVSRTVPDDFAVSAAVFVELGGQLRGSFGSILLTAGTAIILDITKTKPWQ